MGDPLPAARSPSSASVRVADEIITFLCEAKIDNRQSDRPMAGMGLALNLVHGRKTADVAGVPKTVAKNLGSLLGWNLSFGHEPGAWIAAAWNGWCMMGGLWRALVRFKFKCALFKASTVEQPDGLSWTRARTE